MNDTKEFFIIWIILSIFIKLETEEETFKTFHWFCLKQLYRADHANKQNTIKQNIHSKIYENILNIVAFLLKTLGNLFSVGHNRSQLEFHNCSCIQSIAISHTTPLHLTKEGNRKRSTNTWYCKEGSFALIDQPPIPRNLTDSPGNS